MDSNTAKVGMKVEAMEARGSWKNPVDLVSGVVEKVLGPDAVMIKLDNGQRLKIDVERVREIEKAAK